MAVPRPTDGELIARIPSDPAAFTAFYRRHVEDVLGFHERRTGRAEQAADLTAEVFATVLLRAARYDPARGDGRGWLFTIARHKHVDAAAFLEGGAERVTWRVPDGRVLSSGL